MQITGESGSPVMVTGSAVHVGVVAPGGSYVDQVTIPSTSGSLPEQLSMSGCGTI